MFWTRSLGALLALTHLVGVQAAPAPEPATGLADSAALRATVYGTPPQDIAPLPALVPLQEIDIALPWARPLPDVLWFDRRLRVWFSAQKQPAALAIVVAGTGADGNTAKLSLLRATLYGAGYHVLTMPSPTNPGFIAAASSTGVAGDLLQDSHDLYAAAAEIIARLPKKVRITRVDVLGYSLGGAHAAVMKSIDATEHRINIRRAVMINPPVSLFESMNRLDRLFVQSVGEGVEGVDRLYRRLYARLANYYRATDQVRIEDTNLMAAAAAVLRTDADFSAAIALTFRLALMDIFYEGDLYAGTGVVIDPRHPPRPGDPTDALFRELLGKSFADYFDGVFVPYYTAHRPGATRDSLIAGNRLDIIGPALQSDPDYFAQTNADDLILDRAEFDWLRSTLRGRIAVYDHGGHLGNLGDRQQIADMLDMLAGRWTGPEQ
jgi:hypothetical protein